MSSMTKQNADNARQADDLMKEANQVVQKADHSMSELIHSMEEISKASEETSKIIKTIDEIAFQTNLLALNAAVEAARAGEAGAGFAVVADEVRNLAMRAADSARSTADLIEGTVKKVKDGGNLVTTTNEAFSEVTQSAAKVGDLVGEIAAASKEQAEGIEQVNKAVVEMDKVVQQNAANAEESASASEEMNAQAEQMKDFVGNLITMVGSGTKGSKKMTSHANIAVRTSAKGTDPETPVTSAKKVKRPEMVVHQTREVRPERIIPLDDDDFQDF
jgi:methyl-accepting chemotaxis protein